MMPIVFQSLANFRFICQLTGKFNINSNECAFLPVTINNVEEEGELRAQDHRPVFTMPSCTCSRKNSWISNGGGGGNKTICCSNFNMFCVFFCSVHLCVLLLAYTHISQTSCWYKSARPCTSVGAIWVNLLYKKDISIHHRKIRPRLCTSGEEFRWWLWFW